jgi:hypothetical protein
LPALALRDTGNFRFFYHRVWEIEIMKVLVLNPASSSFPNVVRDQIFGCWYKGKEIGGMQMPPLSMLYVTTVLQDSVSQKSAGVFYLNPKNKKTNERRVLL